MNAIVPACQVDISPQKVVIFFKSMFFYFNCLRINDFSRDEMTFCGPLVFSKQSII